jgi:2-dehydro-3-deoxyphosphogluconate aldolase / (4S)-4-hydroxy-2-oxoglutarate aldolase
MILSEQGFRLMKFFPADAAGGLAWLKAVAAPLAGLRFCPRIERLAAAASKFKRR